MPQLKNKSPHLPPVLYNDRGSLRNVGLELEFAGMELRDAAEIIQSCYGGEIEEQHRYQFNVKNTSWGDFGVELDARVLKKMALNDSFKKLGVEIDEQKLMESVEYILDKVARSVIPIEIVMPPVTIEHIEVMERLREELQSQKAEGTKVSWVNAFGMHINIETPDLEAETLLSYLRSFLLVYPWLLNRLEVDVSRRISPFIDPFPNAYTEMVLDVSYSPGRERLIEDYLEFNPTRNRPLDLMPILALLDDEKVTEALEGAKNKPRPTFHYRLPNSRIDDASWTFMEEWRYWLIIEHLAVDREMIHKLSRLYLNRKDKILVSFNKEWIETLGILLNLDEEEET